MVTWLSTIKRVQNGPSEDSEQINNRLKRKEGFLVVKVFPMRGKVKCYIYKKGKRNSTKSISVLQPSEGHSFLRKRAAAVEGRDGVVEEMEPSLVPSLFQVRVPTRGLLPSSPVLDHEPNRAPYRYGFRYLSKSQAMNEAHLNLSDWGENSKREGMEQKERMSLGYHPDMRLTIQPTRSLH